MHSPPEETGLTVCGLVWALDKGYVDASQNWNGVEKAIIKAVFVFAGDSVRT